MHAACSMPPGVVSRQMAQRCKRFMQNNYMQSCQLGIHEIMKACWLVGVGCEEGV
tara:strand:- start:83 stop:247 length:165 start_codon:yes stop_codon:yes gene_type:complete